jgi:hypothetical protein
LKKFFIIILVLATVLTMASCSKSTKNLEPITAESSTSLNEEKDFTATHKEETVYSYSYKLEKDISAENEIIEATSPLTETDTDQEQQEPIEIEIYGDINLDGLSDKITYFQLGNEILIWYCYEEYDRQFFSSPVRLELETEIAIAYLEDIDGSGGKDVVVINREGEVSFFKYFKYGRFALKPISLG